MLQQQIVEFSEQILLIDKELLEKAGLTGRLKVEIRTGEIRILPETPPAAEELLARLAGCLGREAVADYDFSLKIGGLYEAR